MSQQEKILRDLLEEVAKKHNYTNHKISINPINSGGANYSSHLFLATITAPEKDDLNLFAKLAALGEEMRDVVNINLYTNEQHFYKEILKVYRKIEEKYNVKDEDRLPTAKYFGASRKYLYETLVLENLTLKGYQSFNRFESIDWPYASCSIKNLALLHALSIAYSKEDPTGYAFTVESKLSPLPDHLMADGFIKAFDKALQFVKPKNRDRLEKFLENPDIRNPLKKIFSAKGPIIHCDYRPSNMMHKVQQDGTVKVIILDFQTLNQGCPVSDLLNFILLSSDKNFREQYLQKSFELYYQELSAALGRFNLDVSQIYNKKTYEEDIKEFLPYILSWCLYGLLIITVDEGEAPGLNEKITDLAYNINPNKLYIERINDLVDDFIAMGYV